MNELEEKTPTIIVTLAEFAPGFLAVNAAIDIASLSALLALVNFVAEAGAISFAFRGNKIARQMIT